MTNKNLVTFIDLDGTLLNSDRKVSEKDFKTLQTLKEKNVLRVVATGRSPYAVDKVLDNNFPIDYVIFSTGAGVMRWEDKKLLISHDLNKEQSQTVFDYLFQNEYDFMLHSEIPNNHYSYHVGFNDGNHDFYRRIKNYGDLMRPWIRNLKIDKSLSQFLIVLDKTRIELSEIIRKDLNKFSVAWATSPLDHESRWVEIFSKKCSKALTAQWLVNYLELKNVNTMAIGNDFNDIDLLKWSDSSYVVENSIELLKNSHQLVKSNNESGFSDAVDKWLK